MKIYILTLAALFLITSQPVFAVMEDDPTIGIGSGLSDVETRLRLRYEFRREFAPYIGVTYANKYGDTADYARLAGDKSSNTQITLGLKIWF